MTDSTRLDIRQRFFVAKSPVRGDVVQLSQAYKSVLANKNYPIALQMLLGEMLVAASLLVATLKISGSLSIQLQADGETLLDWAMAECDHTGAVRALAQFKDEHHGKTWADKVCSDDAFVELGAMGCGVMFISIHQATGERYQGIVERVSDSFAKCLAHYQQQSAQIATFIKFATTKDVAAGILLQALPQSEQDKENDPDLWDRVCTLAQTITLEELTTLSANEVLYRLYHEEDVVLPDVASLRFACTCSQQKSESAIIQLGRDEALSALEQNGGELALDCGFCGAVYRFNQVQVQALFV